MQTLRYEDVSTQHPQNSASRGIEDPSPLFPFFLIPVPPKLEGVTMVQVGFPDKMFGPQFPQLLNGENNGAYIRVLI